MAVGDFGTGRSLGVGSSGGGSGCQGPDLDQVLGEDPVSAPDPGAVDAGDRAAVPAVSAVEGADSAFGAGSPCDQSAERSLVLVLAPGGGGFGLAGEGDAGDAELVEVVVDAGFAVVTVGGDRLGWHAGAVLDPLDRRGQLRHVQAGHRVRAATGW